MVLPLDVHSVGYWEYEKVVWLVVWKDDEMAGCSVQMWVVCSDGPKVGNWAAM